MDYSIRDRIEAFIYELVPGRVQNWMDARAMDRMAEAEYEHHVAWQNDRANEPFVRADRHLEAITAAARAGIADAERPPFSEHVEANRPFREAESLALFRGTETGKNWLEQPRTERAWVAHVLNEAAEARVAGNVELAKGWVEEARQARMPGPQQDIDLSR